MSTFMENRQISNSKAARYLNARRSHWDAMASVRDVKNWSGGYYHRRLGEIYRFLCAPGQRVLEIGCANGRLLADVRPGFGVGIDASGEMIGRAARRYPDLHFIQADAHHLPLNIPFDVIILSDIVNDLFDVQVCFQEIRRLCHPRTRLIINTYSRLWELPLRLAQRFGWMTPMLPQNWLTVEDLGNLLELADFEMMRHESEILWPVYTPGLSTLFNRFIAKLWPFRYFNLTNLVVARPLARSMSEHKPATVSVIVPARNEAGNMDGIMRRTPEMGASTEIVFVEGHSSDDTYAAIGRAMAAHPHRSARRLRQTGAGKGDAVRLGFSEARGEVLMILDADMTVPPEDLPRFYDALVTGKGEFVNGVRLVYPMEKAAMRYLNMIGNKFFSLAFSWLLGQPIKDTLCGTKVLWKADYQRIADNRAYFGDFDPFGDFDLIFGAVKLNLKIADMPIRYAEREYGQTNIDRWRHGWLLLKMTAFAALRIKLI